MIHQIKKIFIEKGYVWILILQIVCWAFALVIGNSLIKIPEARLYYLGGLAIISIGFGIIMIINIWYGNKHQRTKK